MGNVNKLKKGTYNNLSIFKDEGGNDVVPMIRQRLSSSDDKVLVRLIREELMPYSATVQSESERSTYSRLDHGNIAVLTLTGRPQMVIGFVQFNLVGARYERGLTIDLLAIQSQWRGHGFGGMLLTYAEEFGKAEQARWARVFVDISNLRAQKFYMRHHYRVAKHLPTLKVIELTKEWRD